MMLCPVEEENLFTQRREGAKKGVFTRRRGDAEKKILCRASGLQTLTVAKHSANEKAADAAKQYDTSASPRLRVNRSSFSALRAFAPLREPKFFRHPSESWGLPPLARGLWHKTPAFAGVTDFL